MSHAHRFIAMLLAFFFLANPTLASLTGKRDDSETTEFQPSTLRITYVGTGPINATADEISFGTKKRYVSQDMILCSSTGLAPIFDTSNTNNAFENARQKFCKHFDGTNVPEGQVVTMHIDGMLNSNAQPEETFVGSISNIGAFPTKGPSHGVIGGYTVSLSECLRYTAVFTLNFGGGCINKNGFASGGLYWDNNIGITYRAEASDS